jgi:hypothetical protein
MTLDQGNFTILVNLGIFAKKQGKSTTRGKTNPLHCRVELWRSFRRLR